MYSTKFESRKDSKLSSILSFVVTFFLMFIVWIVLSGNFSPLMIGFGIISSLLVTVFSRKLLFPENAIGNLSVFFKFLKYIPWLHWEILKANFHLLKIVFSPNMMDMIDPHIVDFPTKLTSEISKTTLANSITLTPGTITVNIGSEGNFKVHAIDKPSGKALPGDMLKNVAKIFGESL